MARSAVLPWIVAFKAVKATLLTALGIGLLVSVRRDPVELVWQLAEAVHLPLTSRWLDGALSVALNATPQRELAAAVTALAYALLLGTEGVGLALRRSWARWLTVGATSSLIPLEVYELLQAARPARAFVLVVNVAVVAYLVRRKEVFD